MSKDETLPDYFAKYATKPEDEILPTDFAKYATESDLKNEDIAQLCFAVRGLIVYVSVKWVLN